MFWAQNGYFFVCVICVFFNVSGSRDCIWEFQVKAWAERTLQDEQRLNVMVKRAALLEVHRLAVLTEGYCGIPKALQKNTALVCQVRPWPIPSTAFPIHCSLVVLSFSAI
jgi:hypothetical protein